MLTPIEVEMLTRGLVAIGVIGSLFAATVGIQLFLSYRRMKKNEETFEKESWTLTKVPIGMEIGVFSDIDTAFGAAYEWAESENVKVDSYTVSGCKITFELSDGSTLVLSGNVDPAEY